MCVYMYIYVYIYVYIYNMHTQSQQYRLKASIDCWKGQPPALCAGIDPGFYHSKAGALTTRLNEFIKCTTTTSRSG